MHTTETTPWYRRRWLAIPIGVWAALGATAAIASLLIFFASAPDSYTAASVGSNIDLGNGEGAQIVGTHTLAPGDSVQGCITVDHPDGTVPGYEARLYSTGYVAAGLEDALELTIELFDFEAQFPGELFDCTSVPAGFFDAATTVYSGSLDGFSSAVDWNTGITVYDGTLMPIGTAQAYRFTVSLPEANEALATAGETASLGFVWQGRTP